MSMRRAATAGQCESWFHGKCLTACNLVAYPTHMVTREQAREQIAGAIEAWQSACGESRRPLRDLAAEIGCNVSMLYQFRRRGGPSVGPRVVRGLRRVLEPLPDDVWLAAMGALSSEANDHAPTASRRVRRTFAHPPHNEAT